MRNANKFDVAFWAAIILTDSNANHDEPLYAIIWLTLAVGILVYTVIKGE